VTGYPPGGERKSPTVTVTQFGAVRVLSPYLGGFSP